MKIAILGAGNVGGALGTAFSRVGHEVVFGVRDPQSDKARQALDASTGARLTAFAEAVAGADVVVFALRWDAVPETVAAIGDLGATVVIDAMNRFGGDPTRSTAQDLADLLPNARIAKAFNTTGFENMSTAAQREQPAAMFVAADDDDARTLAMDLAREVGFVPYDVGGLANSKPLEDMVKVWLAIASKTTRRVAFAISEG
jgi:predicted dinucleotide-binding enzyme